MSKKRVLLLVDGDMVAFSHAAAEEYGKEPEEISFAKIQMSMESKMEFMARRVQATKVITCISGKTNMRHVISPDYKSNRGGVWRPENLDNAKASLITLFDGVKKDGLEADDLMAAFAKFDYELVMGKRGEIKKMIKLGPCTYDEVYIASLDKDLLQIGKSNPDADGPVIKHYRWETQSSGEKITTVSGFGELNCIIKQSGKTKKKEIKGNGAKFFLWQMLTGDTTDGVLGCGSMVTAIRKTGKNAGEEYQKRDGVGAVEAFEALDKVTNYRDGLKIVMSKYIFKFGDEWEQHFIKAGRLLYMSNDVTPEGLVRLWHYNTLSQESFCLNSKQIVNPAA